MHHTEIQARDQILSKYPAVWNIDFSYSGGIVVTIKACPNNPPCIVSLSRIIASIFSVDPYTIEIHYFWKPIRTQVLFGGMS